MIGLQDLSMRKMAELETSCEVIFSVLARFLKDNPNDPQIHTALDLILKLEGELSTKAVLKSAAPKPEKRTITRPWIDSNGQTWTVSLTIEDRGPGAGDWKVIDSKYTKT